MDKLKSFYQQAEKDVVLKEKLKQADEAVRKLPPAQQLAAGKAAVMRLAEEAGFSLQSEDFIDNQGDISDDALKNVSGGISSGCFISNIGCNLFGEIDEYGGCIIIGLY